jgi:hypothetical protein
MAMANENQNPLFAYAEARIAAWQAVLASLKNALALDPGGPALDGTELPTAVQTSEPIELPEGAYNGKSLPQCVKLYLSAAKRKKTIKDIATALREGGVESTSPNFEGVVNGALFRLKSTGEVLRFKDGWGLPEWYPANIRASAPASAGKRSAKKKARKGGRAANKPLLADSALKPKAVPSKDKTSDLILELLRTKPEREYSVSEIAEHVGKDSHVVSMVLGTLRKSAKVRLSAPGMCAIGRPQLTAAGD